MSIQALQAATQRLFPPGVEVGACAIGKAPAPMPMEAAAVALAVPKRQAEFAAGRAAVRSALAELGVGDAAILMGNDRAPIWPPGLVGSITHSDGIALAALAPSRHCRGLGLDMEADTPLETNLLKTVCLPEERAWLATTDDPLRWAKLVFSAKEAAYKCQFGSSKTIFGFDGLMIGVDVSRGRLMARFMREVPPFARGARLEGRFCRSEGMILTAFALTKAR